MLHFLLGSKSRAMSQDRISSLHTEELTALQFREGEGPSLNIPQRRLPLVNARDEQDLNQVGALHQKLHPSDLLFGASTRDSLQSCTEIMGYR